MARTNIVSSRPMPSLLVCNRQKARRLNLPLVRRLVRCLVEQGPPPRRQRGAQERLRQSSVVGTPRRGVRAVPPAVPPNSLAPIPDRIPHENLRPGGQLAVYFVCAAEMARLNEQFLGHAGSTDVLTFNYQEGPAQDAWSGEIFVSVDDAVASAPRFRASWQLELARYLVHGVLHLRGYDDGRAAARREMKREENRMLKALSRSFDWSKLERRKHGTRRK
jgi:rRNA maturation RNase YbeY